MNVRSKNGKRTVKLAADERRALLKAANLCAELGDMAKNELAELASKSEQALDTLLKMVEEPEPAVVE